MKKPFSSYLIFALIFATGLSFSVAKNATRAEAAKGVPTILSYQGRLSDSGGNLVGSVSGTTYYFKFSIWDASTGGTQSPDQLWPAGNPTAVPLTVRQGVFNVNIGETGYPDTLNYNFNTNKDIFLEVSVSDDNNTFEALTPRQRISSAPFAQVAGAVSGTGQSSFGTTTPIDNAVVTITATSSNSIPLMIRGALSQSADLFTIENNTQTHLFAVDSTGKVGIGSAAPGRKLEVADSNSTPQIRISQSGSVYGEMYVDSSGDVNLSSTGGNYRMGDENLWVCEGGSCGSVTPVGKGNIIVENSIILNNKFKLKQIDASTTAMYDSAGNEILEFDESQ